MKCWVASMESMVHSSVQRLPRHFGNDEDQMAPLLFSKTERGLTRFDGGSELDMLREEQQRGGELSEAQQRFLAMTSPPKGPVWSSAILKVSCSRLQRKLLQLNLQRLRLHLHRIPIHHIILFFFFPILAVILNLKCR